jgi:hypothetical protein
MSLTDLADDLATKVEAATDAAGRREAIKTWLLAKKENVLSMYEDEDQPIVRNQEAPGDLAVGDYVFASRWGDCDPNDPWATGCITAVGPDYVVLGEVSQRRFPYARRISFEQGNRIAKEYPLAEGARLTRHYDWIAEVFGTFPDA